MRAVRITTNLPVADIEAAKGFYTGYLGLSTEEFNLGWVARYTHPETGAHVQLVTGDATAAEDSAISVHTGDVDARVPGGAGARLRDHPPADHRGVGGASLPRARSGRHGHQRRRPPRVRRLH